VGVEGRNHPLLHPRQPAVGGVGSDPGRQQVEHQRIDVNVPHAQAVDKRLGDPGLPDRLGAIQHDHGSHPTPILDDGVTLLKQGLTGPQITARLPLCGLGG
jgi:hypothetical protein